MTIITGWYDMAAKAADEDRFDNSSVIDAEMQFTMVDDAWYIVRLGWIYSAGTTPDIKFAVGGDVQFASGELWGRTNPATNGSGANRATTTIVSAPTLNMVGFSGNGVGSNAWLQWHGLIQAASATAFGLYWGQNTTDAVNAARLNAGSFIIWEEVEAPT